MPGMTDVAAPYVTCAVADHVATITLDSPHNRNALSRQLITELIGHLEASMADDAVRVVLIESSGTVFCSGADLSEAAGGSMTQGALTIVGLQRLIAAAPKPVVTKNLGAVRAGGIGIIAAADVAISAQTASFALTEVKLGLAPAAISLSVFHRMTSRAAALTALGGAVFDGVAAAEYGLVTRAVPAEDLDRVTAEICHELATGALQGLGATKQILNADLLASIDAKGVALAERSAELFGSEAAKEAMTAFLSRR